MGCTSLYAEAFLNIRVHDGKTDILPTTLKGNTITFETDKFSTYSIWHTECDEQKGQPAGGKGQPTAGKTQPIGKKPVSAKTGDNNAIPLLCVLLVMSGTEVILIITILIIVIRILSFPIRNGTGMIRCNITNVEAVVCLYCRKFFAISYKSVIDKH